jgi:hypothetical protein
VGETARLRVEVYQRGASDVEQRLAAAASTGTALTFRAAMEVGSGCVCVCVCVHEQQRKIKVGSLQLHPLGQRFQSGLPWR